MGKISITRKFLIATHGSFALGIKSSLELILGPTDHIYIIGAYLDGNTSIEAELDELLRDRKVTDEWVIFSDLLGGSITNQILRHGIRQNAHIISGFNLPLLIEIVLSGTDRPLPEIIEEALAAARLQMVYVNNLITEQNKEGQDD
jgi:fructoselysine and glucoselysine-specific PTS system IIA component